MWKHVSIVHIWSKIGKNWCLHSVSIQPTLQAVGNSWRLNDRRNHQSESMNEKESRAQAFMWVTYVNISPSLTLRITGSGGTFSWPRPTRRSSAHGTSCWKETLGKTKQWRLESEHLLIYPRRCPRLCDGHLISLRAHWHIPTVRESLNANHWWMNL